jgi:hypothetical protein
MVDLKALEKAGYSDDKLKKLFTADSRKEKIQKLVELNSKRIDDEVVRNLREAPIYQAIDRAYDISRTSVTYALVNDLLSRGSSATDVLRALEDTGDAKRLREMLVPAMDETGAVVKDKDGNPVMRLDVPVFVQVFLPLVSAYIGARWARLWGQRDQYPLFKYEPVRLTRLNQVRCAIINSLIERMSTDMGYRDDLRSAIQQMLKYGKCILMPQEAYYVEEQIDREGDVKRVREGVRFEIAHPGRAFIDKAHRATAANYNTGPTYGGYWTVKRWGEVNDDDTLWNMDRVNYGYSDDMISMWSKWRIFEPCALKFPTATSGIPQDRLDDAFRYNEANEDDGVTLVAFFHRIIPNDFGLYDYEYPVWHRFLFAGPNTVVHVEPVPYNPLVAFLYDHDVNSAATRSLALELMPFQDQLSNLLSQYLLSVRNNLERIVFWNSDIIERDYIERIRSYGERRITGTTYIPFSRREMVFAQQDKRDAFETYQFPPQNTQELSAAMSALMGMADRFVGFTAQETGGAASHEQSAHEVKVSDLYATSKQKLTSSFVGSAIQNMKVLVYEAKMQYGEDEVSAEIDIDGIEPEQLKEVVKELGYKVENKEDGRLKLEVSGEKTPLEMDAFASEREGEDRMQDAKISAAMIQTFSSMFANPALVQEVGVPQLVSMFNDILHYAGVPLDFRLRIKEQPEKNGQPDPEQIKQQLAAMAQLVDAKLGQFSKEIIAPMAQQTQAGVQQVAQGVAAVGQKLMQLAQMSQAGAQKDQQQDAALMKIIEQIQKLAATNALLLAPATPGGPAQGVGPPPPRPGVLGPPPSAGGQPVRLPPPGFQ